MRLHNKITAIICSLAILLSVGVSPVSAASGSIAPYGSAYINATSWDIGDSVGTTFVVSYAINATSVFADVGATKVQIFRSSDGANWTLMKTYNYTLVEEMMGHNKMNHTYTIKYDGVANYYYRAKVFFWVGDGTNGDERTYYTTTVGLPVSKS